MYIFVQLYILYIVLPTWKLGWEGLGRAWGVAQHCRIEKRTGRTRTARWWRQRWWSSWRQRVRCDGVTWKSSIPDPTPTPQCSTEEGGIRKARPRRDAHARSFNRGAGVCPGLNSAELTGLAALQADQTEPKVRPRQWRQRLNNRNGPEVL